MGGHMGGIGGMGGGHATEGGGHAAVGTATTGHTTEGGQTGTTGHTTEGHMGSTEGGMSNGNTAHGARISLSNQAWGSTTRGTEGGGKVTPPNPHPQPHPHPREVPPPPSPHGGCGMLLLPFEIPCRPVLPPKPPEPLVIPPHDKDVLPPVSLTPPAPDTPTGVFTGLHTNHLTSLQEKYRQHYSVPRAAAGQESLTAPSIGLNHVPIDKVGTGAEEKHYAKKHGGDMVPPQDPFHLGEWKHEIPGKTVIAGHVSFGNNPGPLYNLSHLGIHHGRPDNVTLQAADGTKTAYTYSNHEIVKDPKDQEAWNRVFAPGDPAHPKLVLVTCTGPKITAGDVRHEPALNGSQGLHKWRLVTYLDANPQEKPKK